LLKTPFYVKDEKLSEWGTRGALMGVNGAKIAVFAQKTKKNA
jgi:hypothetical protein